MWNHGALVLVLFWCSRPTIRHRYKGKENKVRTENDHSTRRGLFDVSPMQRDSRCSRDWSWLGTRRHRVGPGSPDEAMVLMNSQPQFLERVACTACAFRVLFPWSLSGREFVGSTIMHGSRMAQANKRLEICLGVSCKSALFVCPCTHTLSSPVVRSSSWSIYSDPYSMTIQKGYYFIRSTILMNTVATPFAVFNAKVSLIGMLTGGHKGFNSKGSWRHWTVALPLRRK